MPHLGVDPIVLAAAVVGRLQTIVSRELSPQEFGVVTVGTIHAGTRPNVIPEQASLGLNVRAYSDDVRERILAAIERIVRGEAAAAGSPREPEIRTSARYPVTENDPDVASRVAGAFAGAFGAERVHDVEPLTASEDFSEIPRAFGAPYCYWALGGCAEGEEVPNHNPRFAPDVQPTLEVGAKALAAAALELLAPRDASPERSPQSDVASEE